MENSTLPTKEPLRKTMSVPEAGAILGVGRNTAYNMAREGVIPTIRLGRRLVVPVVALERLLEAT